MVAILIGVVPSSLTLQVLPFLWVLSAHTSTSPELKHKLGCSAEDFKNFCKVVTQPLGQEQPSRACAVLDPHDAHLTREALNKNSPMKFKFLP